MDETGNNNWRVGAGIEVWVMEKTIQRKVPVLSMLKCLLAAYILTGGMLLLLAMLLYRFQFSEKVVSIVIIIIYIAASFLAGLLAGKKMQARRFIWGLAAGMLYFLVLFVVSLAANHGLKDFGMHFFSTLMLCAGSGMLGGMLS